MKHALFLLLLSFSFFSLAQKTYKGKYGIEDLEKVPPAPDYTNINYWIAYPEKEDMADVVPGKGELSNIQDDAEVDVFFIYPTIYAKKQDKDHPWYADVNDQKLNKNIANSTIKYQASVFNGAGRIYSPLYRQAHIAIYYDVPLKLKVDALALAYEDVENAFEHYLANWNEGRPIIIASHSQGTDHAVRLLRDFFEYDDAMKEKLVAAYIVGMPIAKNTFNEISPCGSPEQTGCWLTWNTYKQGYFPPNHDFWYGQALNVNPLIWTLDSMYVSREKNKGGILKNFKKIRPGLSDAQTANGMLWIHKPKFFGNFLINWDRYHIVDYNLFYLNIRENAARRVEAYLNRTD